MILWPCEWCRHNIMHYVVLTCFEVSFIILLYEPVREKPNNLGL